jgi:hypothetical protein
MPAFVVKAEIGNPRAKTQAFAKARTMYGGKTIAAGDTVFLFASENSGGRGLIAKGVVTKAVAHAKPKNIARWTPRVSIEVRVTARARRPLGRAELRPFRGKTGPEAELDFKLYRQATDKIVGVTDATARVLRRNF